MAGESLLAFAHAEGDRELAPGPMRTLARQDGEGWTLRGRKTAVLGAPAADWLVVSAQIEGSPDTAMFIVARDAPGLVLNGWHTTHEQRAADVEFRDVRVGTADRLGTGHSDAPAAL